MSTDTDSMHTNAGDMPMIRVKNVKKSYSGLLVLDRISFDVHRGEVLAIIGRSGSGKSTMLRCLNLLEEYDDGEIWFDGQLIGYRRIENGTRKRQSEYEMAAVRAEIGMVFQSFNLFPHRNVLDNVTLAPINVKNMNPKEADDLARTLLEKVGLADKVSEFPSRLSGGQQQRVAIARALAMQPKVMLFDEVTSALDPELVGEVLEVMKQLAEEGMTMLIVTHEMSFACDVGTQLIYIDQGKIAQQGKPDDVLQNPKSEGLITFLQRFRMSHI